MTLTPVSKDPNLFVSHSGDEMGSPFEGMQILLDNGMRPAPLEMMARAMTGAIEECFLLDMAEVRHEHVSDMWVERVKDYLEGLAELDIGSAANYLARVREMANSPEAHKSNYLVDFTDKGVFGCNFALEVPSYGVIVYVPERPDIVVEYYKRFRAAVEEREGPEGVHRPVEGWESKLPSGTGSLATTLQKGIGVLAEAHKENSCAQFPDERAEELLDIAFDEARKRAPYEERTAVLITPDKYMSRAKKGVSPFDAWHDPIVASTYRGSLGQFIEAILKWEGDFLIRRDRKIGRLVRSEEEIRKIRFHPSFYPGLFTHANAPPAFYLVFQGALWHSLSARLDLFATVTNNYNFYRAYTRDSRVIGQPVGE